MIRSGNGKSYTRLPLMPAALEKQGFGGVEEDRTPDLRIANATLSQLSYHPSERGGFYPNREAAGIIRGSRIRQ
jgi:hypothetical protein